MIAPASVQDVKIKGNDKPVQPKQVRTGADVIRSLHPPLNVDHASGSALQVIKTALRHYYDSAGPRP